MFFYDIIKNKGAIQLPLFFMLLSFCSFGQMNLSGKSGLMYIPDAKEIKDGKFTLGYNYNPIDYSLRGNGRNPERVLFANLTILPRLDISVSLLQMISTDKRKVKEALGDRQLDLRYLLIKETKKMPSVAIALSSPFTIDAALLTQAVVVTKGFELNSDFKLEATAGMGSPYFVYRDESNFTNSNIFSNFKWQKKSDYYHNNLYLTGPFGGLKMTYRNKVGGMVEWDSQKVNVGLYGVLWKTWTVQAAVLNFDQVMVGSSLSFDLFKPNPKIKR
jgi:hypothetical protein